MSGVHDRTELEAHCYATMTTPVGWELEEQLAAYGESDEVVRLVRSLRDHYAQDTALAETIRQGGYQHAEWDVEPSRSGRWMHLVSLGRTLDAAPDEPPERTDIGFITAGRNEHAHIVRWSPANVVADLVARRALLDEVAGWRHLRLYDGLEENAGPYPCSRDGRACGPMECGVRLRQLAVLRHLAAPFERGR